MRIQIMIAAAVLIAAPAVAADYGRDPLPRDESALQQLNQEQLRIVRRSSRLCAQQQLPVRIKDERNPCVISSTDKAIADSGDPALQAFMPLSRIATAMTNTAPTRPGGPCS